MSETMKENRAGLTGIPRLKSSTKIPSASKVNDSSGGNKSKQDGKQTSLSASTAAGNTNGHHKQKSGFSDAHGKGLSLQGPFNPDIVGNARKPGDKRKKPEYNGGKFLTSVRSYEDLASKRSTQSERDRQRFQRNFNSKVETKFAGGDTDEKKTVLFTAKGPTKPKGYRDLKKSEEELKKTVLHLEVSLRDLNLLKNEEVTSLDKQLKETKEKAGNLEEELNSLKEEYINYKTTSTSEFQEQESSLLQTNKKLQERVVTCIKKLQDSNIDPVTLETLDLDQKEIEVRRQRAVEQALSLQQKLKDLSEKNKSLMENIQNCIDGSG